MLGRTLEWHPWHNLMYGNVRELPEHHPSSRRGVVSKRWCAGRHPQHRDGNRLALFDPGHVGWQDWIEPGPPKHFGDAF